MPFIAPFTGAEFLRDPALTDVVNIRASYFEETETIVDRLVARPPGAAGSPCSTRTIPTGGPGSTG